MKGGCHEGGFHEREGTVKEPPLSGQQAGGTHPTGILSCLPKVWEG